jgi:hypothetical protein
LISFQNKFNVHVQYPGSNSYKYTGEAENAEELGDVPPEELVKVAGAREAVGEAIEHLKVCCSLARSSQWPCSRNCSRKLPMPPHQRV